MGIYYRAVCHTCRTVHTPRLMKVSEIRLNPPIAATLGRWLCNHANGDYTGIEHRVELLGDLDEARLRAIAGYREEEPDHAD